MSDAQKYPLTEDQFNRLYDDYRTIETLGKTIGNAILAASAESAKLEREMWDSVEALVGESRRKKRFRIDWVNRIVEVRDAEPGDK